MMLSFQGDQWQDWGDHSSGAGCWLLFFNYFVWSFPSNSLFFKGGRNHIWADGLHAPQWEDAGDFLARQEVLETGRKNVPQQVETSFTFTLSFSNLNLESFIRGDLHVAPFTDEALYMEQFNKVNFWYQEYFHGVNLSSLRSAALTEYFRQPIVDTFDINICTAKTQRHVIDFQVNKFVKGKSDWEVLRVFSASDRTRDGPTQDWDPSGVPHAPDRHRARHRLLVRRRLHRHQQHRVAEHGSHPAPHSLVPGPLPSLGADLRQARTAADWEGVDGGQRQAELRSYHRVSWTAQSRASRL